MKVGTQQFASFPNFTQLELSDRLVYQQLIDEFPPIADISFPSLMTWWSSLATASISLLDKNVVITYYIPGYEEVSGFGLIGTNNVDQAICTIFDYQKQNNEEAKLVHVPEFTINNMHHPHLFDFKQERDFDECIVSTAKIANIDFMPQHWQQRVKTTQQILASQSVKVRELNVFDESVKDELLQLNEVWTQSTKLKQYATKLETQSLEEMVKDASSLGVECLGLYIDGKLEAFALYQLPAKQNYGIFYSARYNCDYPYMFEYMVYMFALWFDNKDIKYCNLDADIGLSTIRAMKLSVCPVNFFRKYTIKPQKAGS